MAELPVLSLDQLDTVVGGIKLREVGVAVLMLSGEEVWRPQMPTLGSQTTSRDGSDIKAPRLPGGAMIVRR